MSLKTGDAGLEIIRGFEKFEPEPYLCPANYATIGYGHVVRANGRMLKGREGLATAQRLFPNGITEEQAEDLMRQDVEPVEDAINEHCQVELTQGQFDALVSLGFNIGIDALLNSTLFRMVNAGDFDAAAEQFKRWNKSGGRVLPGLTRRRAAERELFLG